MGALWRNPLTVVWAILVVVTVASWLIAIWQEQAVRSSSLVTASVLLIAALKAQLVIMYFMEVRTGPGWLKYATYGWVAGLTALLLAFSLLGI